MEPQVIEHWEWKFPKLDATTQHIFGIHLATDSERVVILARVTIQQAFGI